jgi:hypothetical protein
LVNDQLSLLYEGLLLEGCTNNSGLNLEDGTSSSSGEEVVASPDEKKERKKVTLILM